MVEVMAGIVLFNPDIGRLQENIDSIYKQVNTVICIDNGSRNISEIRHLMNTYEEVRLVENNENYGIAYALNQIFMIAEDSQFPWVITLDQDSICSDELIDKMIVVADDKTIGIVCPAINYVGWTSNKKSTVEMEFVKACMTSASLTNVKAWKQVGGFCEDYFIDFVDNDFCMKLTLGGYKIIRVNTCCLNHELGESGEIKILHFLKIRYTKHSAWRYYYMTRNNIVFIKSYRKNINWVKEYIKLVYLLVTSIIVENNRYDVLKYIKKGYADASKNKMGRLE